MPTKQRARKLNAVLQNRQRDLTVVCENIHDPHNVSAILRTCDAVGISEVHLLYYIEKFPKLGTKSSASAKKWVEKHRAADPGELAKNLKEKNYKIYATYVSPGAKSIFEIDWTEPSAIVMGNEHRGVSKEILEIADEAIYIPMMGMVESLNVSVATAVTLYEACRQRLRRGKYPARELSDGWLQQKFEEWT